MKSALDKTCVRQARTRFFVCRCYGFQFRVFMGLLRLGRRGSLNSVLLLGFFPSGCFLQRQCVRLHFVILFYFIIDS